MRAYKNPYDGLPKPVADGLRKARLERLLDERRAAQRAFNAARENAGSAKAPRLPRQSENISPPPLSNPLSQEEIDRNYLELTQEIKRPRTPLASSYRRKRAFEVETNIAHAYWLHGLRMGRLNGHDVSTREKAAYWGCRYSLEFTVTLPGDVNVLESPSLFGKAWDKFNRKWLLRRSWIRSWLMIKEAHKDGRIHAHVLLLVDRDTWRSDKGPKFNKATGLAFGSTVAPWVREHWKDFREVILPRYGLGERHTFQPIRHPEKFAKYIAKYLTKGFREERPEHLKHVRLVAYSEAFPRCARVYTPRERLDEQGNTYRTRIHYMSKAKRNDAGEVIQEPEPKRRTEMATAFSFYGPATNERRSRLARQAAEFGCADLDQLKAKFGDRYAYFIEPLLILREPRANWAEMEDGALSYLLAGIAKFTPLVPLMAHETTGNLMPLWKYEDLDHDEKKLFSFAWSFEDSTGEILSAEYVKAERLPYFYGKFLERAWSRLEAIEAGDGDATRTIKRERLIFIQGHFLGEAERKHYEEWARKIENLFF